MISQQELKQVLSYNEDTGIFTWLVKRGPVNVGDIAGCKAKFGERSTTLYISIFVKGKPYLAHRLAWLYVYGEFPEFNIDHDDGCGINNRISNLLDKPQSSNAKNRKLQKNNRSGINGVKWYARYGKWRAFIGSGGKMISLGYFDTMFDAACIRKSAENQHGYHSNHGRR